MYLPGLREMKPEPSLLNYVWKTLGKPCLSMPYFQSQCNDGGLWDQINFISACDTKC